MTTWTVIYSKPGDMRPSKPFGNLDAAIEHAARLAHVTPRTIRKRLATCDQVGGREIGDDGVWIERRD